MYKETDCGTCIKEDVCHIRLTRGGMQKCRNYFEDPRYIATPLSVIEENNKRQELRK